MTRPAPAAPAPALALLALLVASAAATYLPLKPPAGSVNLTTSLASAAASPPTLKPRVLPPGPQLDVPFNYAYFDTFLNSECYPASLGYPLSCPPTLPWSDPRLAAPAGCSPDQVALKWWGTAAGGPAVLVSWATCAPAYLTAAGPAADTAAGGPSVVRVGKAPGVYDKAYTGVPFSYTVDFTQELDGTPTNGGLYVSPVLHHARVGGLVPGSTYYYKIDGPPGTEPFAGSFKVPGGFPTRFGVVADPGQTRNTTVTFDFLQTKKPDLLLMAGDLTYADNTGDWQMYFDWGQAAIISGSVNTFSPRWDAWGRLVSPLASKVPLLTTVGNHEIEQTPEDASYPTSGNGWDNTKFKTRYANYLARYPAPQTEAQALHGPTSADLAATTPGDDPARGLYSSTVVPGTATIITLSSYTFDPVAWTPADPMYAWLEKTLAAVDRAKTPWVVVMTHVSWYSTALPHAYEAECFRATFEPLFRRYGVDIFIAGHDHDYERTAPVYDYRVDPECGTVYLVTGYNGDEVGYGWMDKWETYAADPSLLAYAQPFGPNKVATCAVPTVAPASGGYTYNPPPYALQWPGFWGADGRCVASKVAASGGWCPDEQPPHSAWRESVYGAGVLDFLSPTEAVWSFFAQGTAMVEPADEVVVKRNPGCALKAAAADGTLVDTVKDGVTDRVTAAIVAAGGADAAALAAVDAKVAGWADATGAVDPGAAAAGIKRQVTAGLAAAVAGANFTKATLTNALRNKTGW